MATTTLGGNLSGTLSLANSPYVAVSNLLVDSNSALLIEPGVVIRFSPSTGLEIAGTLLAQGTPSAPILFTSLQDGTTAVAPGQWNGLTISNSASKLEHVVVRYGGDNIHVNNASPVISDSVIDQAAQDGISAPSGQGPTVTRCQILHSGRWGLLGTGQMGTLDGNTLDGNAYGMQLENDPGSPILRNSVFRNTQQNLIYLNPDIFLQDGGGNVAEASNHVNGIDLLGVWKTSGTWNFTSLPYLLRFDDVTIGTGQESAVITAAPGSVFKGQGRSLQVNDTLLALGTASAPITFTSVFDNSAGGQTVAGATAAQPGNWSGITLGQTSSASRLDHVVVRYGGDDIHVNNASPEISDSVIDQAGQDGISAPSGQGPTVTRCQILHSGRWGLLGTGQIGTLDGNTLDGNAYGIQLWNDAGSPVLRNTVFRNTQQHLIYLNPEIFLQDGGGNVAEASNHVNGIDLVGTWKTSGTWGFTSLPYLLRFNDVTIGTGQESAVITAAPGSVFKGQGRSLQVNDTLLALGTASAPITFTSVFDNTVGGQTSSGGTAARPGDWGSVLFNPTSSTSRLDHVVVRYGGDDIHVNNASPEISDSVIDQAGQDGISAPSGQGPSVTRCQILHSGRWGLLGTGQIGTLDGNTLDGNAYGIQLWNDAGSPVLRNTVFRNTQQHLIYLNPNIFLQDGGGNVAEASNHINGIDLVGTWTTSGTLNFMSLPYLFRLGDMAIGTGQESAVITVAPGVVFKGQGHGLQVNDTLLALGTVSAPITFTSVFDNTVGGQTSSGGTAARPGDWGSVLFNPTSSTSRLDHVVVRYGGDNIHVNNASPEISDSVIDQAGQDGISAPSSQGPTVTRCQILHSGRWGLLGTGQIGTLDGNTLDGNAYGIQLWNDAGSPVLRNTVFRNTQQNLIYLNPEIFLQDGGGNVAEASNHVNGIDLVGTWRTSGTWGFTSLPYLLRFGTAIGTGQESAVITVAPGVVFKGQGNGLQVNDTLLALGTAGAPITFTSIFDSTVGGQTLPGTTAAKPGDWGGVSLTNPTSSATRLDHVVVRYGGTDVSINNSSASITNSRLTRAADGLFSAGTLTPIVTFNMFSQNERYGVLASASNSLEIHFNNIFGSTQHLGLNNTRGDVDVHAQSNYWGDASGPGGAGPGTGDSVSAHVLFSPFLTSQSSGTKADTLPPRTHFLGLPEAGQSPLVVSSSSVASLPAVDDRATVGDGAGVGVAQTWLSVDGHSFSAAQSTFSISPPGLHNLSFYSIDTVGNRESPVSAAVFVDTVPPVSRLLIEGSSQTFSDGSIGVSSTAVLSWTASDPLTQGVAAGVANIQVAIDTQPFSIYAGSVSVSAAGRHAIQWTSVDQVGNSEPVRSLTIVVSTTAGAAVGLAPETQLQITPSSYTDTTGRLYASAQSAFSFAVNDHGNGTAFTQYSVDGSSPTFFTNPFALSGGTHTLQYQSQDLLSNLETLHTKPLWVDGAPPVSMLVTSPPAAALATGQLAITTSTIMSLTAVDVSSFGVISGVQDIQWNQDGSSFQTFVSSFSQTGQGSHMLQWTSHDRAGNEEPLRTATVVVDGTPPTIQVFLSPDAVVGAGNQLLADTATTVGFAMNDALTGIATAEVRIDATSGNSFQPYTAPFTLSVGTHTVEARAWDGAGNLKSVAPFTISVSTAAPPIASPDPTGGTLPDGTPITGSPTPIPVPLPSTTPSLAPALPVVSAVTFTPSSPLSAGNFSVTIRFSTPMDNTRAPAVTVMLPSASTATPLQVTSYVGDSWSGSGVIPNEASSGAGNLNVLGAQSINGHVIPQSHFGFQVNNTRLSAPAGVTVDFAGSTEAVRIGWLPVVGVSQYRVYRATASFGSSAGLDAIAGGDVAEAFNVPNMNAAAAYFGVTAVGPNDIEGPLSAVVSIPMPLPPIITFPLPGANADVSSTVLRGVAQPGATILLSASVSSGTLATTTADTAGQWTSPLTLGIGDFTVLAKAQSPATLQISSAAAVALHLGVLPLAPANLIATAGDTTVTLTWTASPQPNVTGYNIYRDSNAVPLNAKPIPQNQVSYQDIGLTDGRVYSYAITSVRNDGVESNASESVPAKPAADAGWGNQ